MTTTQVGRMLDEEHRANLELLSRMEQAIGRAPALTPQITRLLLEFAHAMEHDIGRHFRFEEEQLFPRIADAGDGAMAALLQEEHEAIREAAAELVPLAREAAAGTIDEEGWDRLRLVTLELVERQVSHIQKETMALLPTLEDVLDPVTDGELALDYAATA
jgi:iron-sulfur cluster repair protein YtfE (RIC family)